jgi:sporulation protein YunB
MSKKRRALITVLAVFLSLFFLLALHYTLYVSPTIKRISEEKVREFATNAVGRASNEIISDNYSYKDLVEITKNGAGDIVLIQANTVLTHALLRSAAAKTGEYLNGISEIGVKIPIGTLSGISLFSGKGPSITIKVLPIGVVSTNIYSEFTQAGINQALHRIYCTIRAEVNVILPGNDSRVSAVVPIPISESVIVGKVPEVYFGGNLFDSLNKL